MRRFRFTRAAVSATLVLSPKQKVSMSRLFEKERRSSSEGGFTLIELLVVVVILGILSAIAVFGVSNAQTRANLSACNANAQQLLKAYEAYYAMNNQTYPTASSQLVPTYLKSVPTSYGLSVSTATGTPVVTSTTPGCSAG